MANKKSEKTNPAPGVKSDRAPAATGKKPPLIPLSIPEVIPLSIPVVMTEQRKWAPPATPATLTARQVDSATIECNVAPVADRDLAGFAFRIAPQGESLATARDWQRARQLNIQAAPPQPRMAAGDTMAALMYRIGPVPGGNWTIGVKAVDTSGNLSPGVASADIHMRPHFNFIDDIDLMAQKTRRLTGFLDIDGKLVPTSTLAPRRRSVGEWNTFCPAPPPKSTLLSGRIDLGSIQRGMTVSYDVGAILGFGRPDDESPALTVFIRNEDGARPDVWIPFNAGFVTITGRRFRVKVESDNRRGRSIITHMRVLFDLVEISDAGGEVAVPTGGTPIVFKRAFTRPPDIARTALNDRDHYVTLADWTTSGATLHVRRRTDNRPAGDTVRWSARGV